VKIITILGAALIVLGVIGLIYGGITYTSGKDVVDMGPLHVEVEQQRQIPVTPIAGAITVVIGAVLIFVGGRRPGLGRHV
jgi:hypothetical protein